MTGLDLLSGAIWVVFAGSAIVLFLVIVPRNRGRRLPPAGRALLAIVSLSIVALLLLAVVRGLTRS